MEKQKQNKGVLFVYDSLRIGGCERVISVLSRKMAEKGIDVSILMIKKNKVEFDMPSNVKILSYEDFQSPMRYLRKLFYCIEEYILSIMKRVISRFNRRIFENFDEYVEARIEQHKLIIRYCGFMRNCFKQYDGYTIISFMDNPNFATLIAAKGLKNKVIISERNHPGRDNVQSHIKRYRNRLYKTADICVFQTQEEMDYYPEEVKRIGVIIENPVKEELPAPYFGERNNEIITFCRIDKQKNLPGLIDAFELISEKYPDYILAIYGKGNQYENILKYIKEQGMEEKVFLREHDSCVHEKVKDAAMFVSFSNYEGISNSMLEAMAIGLPSICTDCPAGGANMVIQNKVNGLLVPVGDVKCMAESMEFFINNPEIAKEIGAEAANVRNTYHVNRITEKWMELI